MRSASPFVLASWLAACDSTASEDACGIPNAELSMVATVVDNGADIHAEVDFGKGDREGPPGPLALCESDELTIAGKQPERIDRSDRVVYSTSLAATAARAVPFLLIRSGEPELSFTIELAPPFDITAPTPELEVSRSADFMLSWAPPQAGAQIQIGLVEEIGNGICLETTVADHDYKSAAGVAVDDDGGWNIPASVIDGGTRDKCDAAYLLTRVTAPEYPGELHDGGYLQARVERTVAFVSVP